MPYSNRPVNSLPTWNAQRDQYLSKQGAAYLAMMKEGTCMGVPLDELPKGVLEILLSTDER